MSRIQPPVLEREEYVEQAYFFETFRERLADGIPSQQVLESIGEELLATTKLPMAASFMATELRLSGLMSPAMERLGHYFTAFQVHVIAQAEAETTRFSMDRALLVLHREAKYKADGPKPAALFIYQFEALTRNRLGFTEGLEAIAADPFYDETWQEYILRLRTRLGDVDFADLIFVQSEYFLQLKRQRNPEFRPKFPILFGPKEGKIARANRGRDPLYLFAALQRQLGYPEVPRPPRPDSTESRLALMEQRIAALEQRVQVAEGALNADDGDDLSAVQIKPDQTAGIPAGWGSRGGSEPPPEPAPGRIDLDISHLFDDEV